MPSHLTSALLRCTLVAAFVAATGCGRISIAARAATPLNPNEHGESTPVDVRFYQLRRPDRFRAATVEQLWTADGPTLALDRCADPVTATIVPAAPGRPAETVALGRRAAGAEWIGVLALFPHGDARDARSAVLRVDELGEREILLSGRSVVVAERLARTQPAETGATSGAPQRGGKAGR